MGFHWELPSGELLEKMNWKDSPHFLMGKLTVSNGPFSRATLVITRGSLRERHHVSRFAFFDMVVVKLLKWIYDSIKVERSRQDMNWDRHMMVYQIAKKIGKTNKKSGTT